MKHTTGLAQSSQATHTVEVGQSLMQTGRLKVRWSWLASLLRHYLQAWATMGRLTSTAGKPGRRPDRAVPLPATKAQSNPEVEVSAELSEASNSGSRARRETSVTRHSSLGEYRNLPFPPLLCSLHPRPQAIQPLFREGRASSGFGPKCG